MSTIPTRNSWGFDNFHNFFWTQTVTINEIVLYVLSQILGEPIHVILKDDVWNTTVNYMLGETKLHFVYGGENCFIPLERMTDSELEVDFPVKKGNLLLSISGVYTIIYHVVLAFVCNLCEVS